jgi:hypothetical protein
MGITTKLSVVSVLALLTAASAAVAQQSAIEGDHYAPTNTVVQQPTAQELKKAQEGDYYAPTHGPQVDAQRATTIEKCTQQTNAQYPDKGSAERRFNGDAYLTCMTEAGQKP